MESHMRAKIQLFILCAFVMAVFFAAIPAIYAVEGTPPGPQHPADVVAPEGKPTSPPSYEMDPNAKAVLPTDTFDFGSVYEGNDVFHDFIIKNEGTADLKIYNVKSG